MIDPGDYLIIYFHHLPIGTKKDQNLPFATQKVVTPT